MHQQTGQHHRQHDGKHHLNQRANLPHEYTERRRQYIVRRKAFPARERLHRLLKGSALRPAGHVQRHILDRRKIHTVDHAFNPLRDPLLRFLRRGSRRKQQRKQKKRRKPSHCSAPTAICVSFRKIGSATPSSISRPQSSARQAIDGASISRQTCAANCVISTMPIALSMV